MTPGFQYKLIVPMTASPLVERGPLVARLDQTIETKQVVVLTAPAGWGKTTALVQWAAQSTLPVAWYTLDSADRDPHVFLNYLLRSISNVVPGAARLIDQLPTISPHGLPELCRAAALEIAAAPSPFVLVLDDFHVLEREPSAILLETDLILELLSNVTEYAPNCHLVLLSRTPPSLHGFIRLAAQRRAVVFDYAALQLSTKEVQDLAKLLNGMPLSEAQAEQLTAQMNGWVAGIVLSLDRSVHVIGQPVTATGDTPLVYAFFAEQLFAPLAAELQRFLEDTSVLDDLSPQRCNALRQTTDAARFLDEIVRRGLFVSNRGGWLAYHSLFREFLRTRLAYDPTREKALLRRAGDLYRDEDDIERSLDCYLAINDGDAAIALLRQAIPRFRQRSRHSTLLSCFERLDTALSDRRIDRILPPDILLMQARVYGDLPRWDRAHLAIQLAETVGDDAIRWEAAILSADMQIVQGDYTSPRARLDQVCVTKLPPRLQLEYYLVAGRLQNRLGEIDAAIAALEQALKLVPTAVDSADLPGRIAAISDSLGLVYAIRGDRQIAAQHLQRADVCWQACGNSGRRAITLNNLGMIALEDGHYQEARAVFETGLALAQDTVRYRDETILRCSIADLDIIEGRLEAACEHFSAAHALAVRMAVPGSAETASVGMVWTLALRGNLDEARTWQHVVIAGGALRQPAARGRNALAQSIFELRGPRPKTQRLLDHATEALAVEGSLSLPERAYLALLRAAPESERARWPDIAPMWKSFEALAEKISEPLLGCFAALYHRLFEIATEHSSLARRLANGPSPSPSRRRWEINALGAFTCLVDGVLCELSPLHRALLVRLLDAGPQGLTVERLWEDVWGDSDLRMTALHKALHRLRDQTSITMAARGGYCSIQAGWESIDYDVRMFEQALTPPLTREALVRAGELYRGDFLMNASIGAMLWVDRRRSQLQQRYLEALDQLARLCERDEPARAVQYYQQVLQIDSCREETAIQLMRLAGRLRNHTLIDATFAQLEGALRTLGTTPEPSTMALYQELR